MFPKAPGIFPNTSGVFPDDDVLFPDDWGSLPADAGTFPDSIEAFPDVAGALLACKGVAAAGRRATAETKKPGRCSSRIRPSSGGTPHPMKYPARVWRTVPGLNFGVPAGMTQYLPSGRAVS
jgi:hypothetical protein